MQNEFEKYTRRLDNLKIRTIYFFRNDALLLSNIERISLIFDHTVIQTHLGSIYLILGDWLSFSMHLPSESAYTQAVMADLGEIPMN